MCVYGKGKRRVDIRFSPQHISLSHTHLHKNTQDQRRQWQEGGRGKQERAYTHTDTDTHTYMSWVGLSGLVAATAGVLMMRGEAQMAEDDEKEVCVCGVCVYACICRCFFF
jgi:hypothetical protein